MAGARRVAVAGAVEVGRAGGGGAGATRLGAAVQRAVLAGDEVAALVIVHGAGAVGTVGLAAALGEDVCGTKPR